MGCIKVFIIYAIYMMALGEAKDALQLTPKATSCSCYFDGSYYNLRSLGIEDRTQPAMVARKNDYEYGYNPCFPFTLGGKCTNVVICKWTESDVNFHLALGRGDNVTCLPPSEKDSDKNIKVYLVFHQPGNDQKGWTTTIRLKCNKTLEKPNFTILDWSAVPVLQVEHKCCCPDMCPDLISPSPIGPKKKIEAEVIGGATGGVLFLLVLFGLIIFAWRKKRRNRNIRGDRNNGYQTFVTRPNPGQDDDDDDDDEQPAAEHEDEPERPASVPVQVESGREDQQSPCRPISASPSPVEHP
ncbi:uncharacterized protein LOC110249956 [Exaiptasia diaphana]|uniref:Uncharacterized protein n=1 Tax=Exaiptasia diaphana TaxID=2652724 RepID=A0A913XZ45_EXADI|nr:uncharacterized protein LOC110249956 [Exaiptasia diaphana]XP_020912196.1 uncharacterized protein LOC110249956 [Exaiptasia diaphana]KXJ23767.1 hypothetical protein AC249_AIPGENE4538 [Exaiptasia diaphana]